MKNILRTAFHKFMYYVFGKYCWTLGMICLGLLFGVISRIPGINIFLCDVIGDIVGVVFLVLQWPIISKYGNREL